MSVKIKLPEGEWLPHIPLHPNPNFQMGLREVSNSLDARDVLYVALGLLTTALLRTWHRRAPHKKHAYPPSPRSFPILGNIFSVPSGMEHTAYMTLSRQLNSDIVFLKLLDKKILILNSSKAATDLLEKNSSTYSDRAAIPMIGDSTLMDWADFPSLLGYNELWRSHRRMLNNWLNARTVAQFHDLQERQSRLMLQRLLDVVNDTSHELFSGVKEVFFFSLASTMFQLAYGYQLRDKHDPIFKEAVLAIDNMIEAGMYTNFLVNLFPALSYVPDWFPGTGWKRTAREWRKQKEHAVNVPYEWTKAQVAAGVAEPSILRELLQNHKLTSEWDVEERDRRLKQLAMVIYAGGTDTSSNVLTKFIAAMVLNPHVQAKAQQELEEVLGQFTLPTMADQDRLPYIRNVVLETLRWHPVVPLGIPHMCFEDDVYRGYEIPKGTIVIGNIWAMSRDENIYKDPETFDPDRFLDPTVPPLSGFGWGRRKCPGIHFGEASVFISIASMLATFTFSKKKNAHGEEVIPEVKEASNSMIMGLKSFEFEMKVRSDKHRQLIQHGM
ncbi:O-methylsterigmatocystin oxidoreductase [Ceratobasidium theobromae]|uniref:O-methylsterigmatocystin oxidoreductase n=1 Tax=Ceratobasidium theobromae TaxID=1582974 RepID=A0A5N5Q9S0_9AGAM|nr:O-methylsterigmatocystin oxidoreductase [Ceratobasidium theobromae]